MKSLRFNEGNNRTEAVVVVGIAAVVVEVEGTCISTIVVVTTSFEPRIFSIHKVRVNGLIPIPMSKDINTNLTIYTPCHFCKKEAKMTHLNPNLSTLILFPYINLVVSEQVATLQRRKQPNGSRSWLYRRSCRRRGRPHQHHRRSYHHV